MKYYHVYLRGVRDIYTWHSEKPLSTGDRVIVSFRNRPRLGIIVQETNQPNFKTLPVKEVLDHSFVHQHYLELAKDISAENFTSLSKVLGLMIPESFLLKQDPVKKQSSYTLKDKNISVRGEKQQLAIQILNENNGQIEAEKIREKIPLATLKNLEKKGTIEQIFGSIKPNHTITKNPRKNFDLNPSQNKIFANVMTSEKPTLLWGVTGSGKTEIYKKISAEVMTKNPDAQVLFLVPEIALGPQLIADFQSLFGEQVEVWHSNLTPNEKVQSWARMQSGEAKILIGTRSAVLVPLKNPKLIILDEEHEWTFKNEFAPRYWTHDIAEKIRGFFGSKLLFGSATPRLESLKKCTDNHWNLEHLLHKVHQTKTPDIQLINLANEGKKGNHTPLSENLIKALVDIKRKGKQAVLFLNKRGFAGSTMCKSCGTYFECPHCSANMKLHRNRTTERLICHTCGHMEHFPETCPHCKANDFLFRGWGTQQVEAELKNQLPHHKFIRADADTVTGRYDFEKILEKFHAKEADILLGTQMIAKGLDFDDVELVGVILADVGLSLPDFRSEERVFQLLTQVAGRAGRRHTPGKILIQTFHPDDKIFQLLRTHDIEQFQSWQLETRRDSHLPPFSHLAKLTISDPDKAKAFRDAKALYENIKKSADFLTSIKEAHFAPAFFPRSHNKYHFHIVLKADTKKNLRIFLDSINLPDNAKIDLDPVSLL